MKMKYITAYGDTLAKLEERVAMWIDEGWRPQGGIAVCVSELQKQGRSGLVETMVCTYYQAMVKGD